MLGKAGQQEERDCKRAFCGAQVATGKAQARALTSPDRTSRIGVTWNNEDLSLGDFSLFLVFYTETDDLYSVMCEQVWSQYFCTIYYIFAVPQIVPYNYDHFQRKCTKFLRFCSKRLRWHNFIACTVRSMNAFVVKCQ